jgi:hypothetical protein
MHNSITDIDFDKNQYLNAIVIEKYQLLYISIPKCGSSTVKDYLHYIINSKVVGTKSHKFLNPYSKLISFDSLENEYKKFFKFAVVRDPKSRIRSYYSKNIREAGSLRKGLIATSSNLDRNPSYNEILKNFKAYRSESTDFRHHTKSITSCIGDKPDRYDLVVDLSRIDDLIFELEKFLDLKLPTIYNMKSKRNDDSMFNLDTNALETKVLDDFYKYDFEIYQNYFLKANNPD